MNKDSFQINPAIFKEGYENATLQIKITKPVFNGAELSVPGKGFVNGDECPEGTLENLNDDQIRNLVIANVILLTEDQEVKFNQKFYPNAKAASVPKNPAQSKEISELKSALKTANDTIELQSKEISELKEKIK